MKTQLIRLIAIFAAVLLACTGAVAQPYPNKPVKFVVGFVPGGAPDTVARALSIKLSETQAQSFIVDNKPGAGVPADTIKDFVPIRRLTTEPLLIVSHEKSSIKTLQDLIRQATIIKWTSPEDYREYHQESQTKFDRAVKIANLQAN